MRTKHLLIHKIWLVVAGAAFFMSCRKEVDAPDSSPETSLNSFHISDSRLILREGNATARAVAFTWGAVANAKSYTIEADLSESSLEDPIELISTGETNASFSVCAFNSFMCKLLYTNKNGNIDFRIRANMAKGDPVYSSPTAMNITTYQPFIVYDNNSILKIPGNYQGWSIATAPKIIATDNAGEYEGYVNFTNPYPQLLLVKGDTWDTKNTFTYIGADKFGFGGSVISVFGGVGDYLFRANTNTNKWSYTKIDNWEIKGSAVNRNVNPEFTKDAAALSWSVTTNLVKGSFRIRANHSDDIVFGNKAGAENGVPGYNGDNIEIKKNGSYTITLALNLAGNYAYSIQRN